VGSAIAQRGNVRESLNQLTRPTGYRRIPSISALNSSGICNVPAQGSNDDCGSHRGVLRSMPSEDSFSTSRLLSRRQPRNPSVRPVDLGITTDLAVSTGLKKRKAVDRDNLPRKRRFSGMSFADCSSRCTARAWLAGQRAPCPRSRPPRAAGNPGIVWDVDHPPLRLPAGDGVIDPVPDHLVVVPACRTMCARSSLFQLAPSQTRSFRCAAQRTGGADSSAR
jgi:hypothetical protein